MRSLDSFNFNGKKALIRVDFNVPIDNNIVTDSSRIVAAKNTIEKVCNDGGSCILMSHLGRPNGFQLEYSLSKIVKTVESVLNKKVFFSEDVIGKDAIKKSSELKRGEVLLLENVRFHNEETAGDIDFSRDLSKLGDCYINDAFGTAHRAHSSTTVVAGFFKDKFFGKLLEKEVKSIKKVMSSGEKPVLAILGGAKISSKIPILKNIIKIADDIIIGGGMSFTFAKALGGKIGNSIHEDSMLDEVNEIIKIAKNNNVKVHIPVDVVCAKEFDNNSPAKVFDIMNIDKDYEGMDAGPKSLLKFKEVVLNSKTILWNGPLGVFEFSNFSKGTKELGKYISESTQNGAFSLVGGGDSVAAVRSFKMQKNMSYVSTGGGAMLESLEGKNLPGINALLK
tara:strand:+ start:3851 stop:5032 length:1182 start_codon:yes stop_codon:yes gene_type:complete